MTEPAELRNRAYEITVGGLGVEALRCGFTIDRTLAKEPNTAEIALYNLHPETRGKFHAKEGVPVVVKAGYADTGLCTIFVGELREGFSRPERDGSWVTVLRSGDGDKAKRKTRANRGMRPGISLEQAVSQLARDMKVGIGNVGKELLSGNLDGIGDVFAKGLTGSGSAFEQMDRLARSAGLEISVQDGELQAIKHGDFIGVRAVVLQAGTGLEGVPEIDGKGLMTCRARIVPGLVPGYPIEVISEVIGLGLWRIEKVRYVGDTHGDDWSAEISAREVIV
jgi:hypothetical protein